MSSSQGSTPEVLTFTAGMRIALRDAEWRIDRVDVPTHGGLLLTCTGQSELVRGHTGRFLTELETDTQILSPETTHLADDLSTGYAASQLYIDALLQTTPPADAKIHLGHEAAMDLLPYQLDPALQALNQTRPRILIADSVGLGKTMGAGILMTELIRRNRGKRILVLATKSMLGQLQRELWQRFTIPLVRLDSVGLQRIRNTIPSNHNPFHYIDRSIISIDTLKQSLEYRHYLKQCHWDIVVIDEAHNVAQRSSNSLRHRLAQMLCTRCDAMLMLSATPHDGRAESFASLIHMLDPTAIPNPSEYQSEDYRGRGLVVRRFKKDVADQLQKTLPERVVYKPQATASSAESHAHEVLSGASFQTLNRGSSAGAGHLFRTTLEKTLLSSPAACLSTIDNRLRRLQRVLEAATSKDAEREQYVRDDIDTLNAIRSAVAAIGIKGFSKYQLLLEMLAKVGKAKQNSNDVPIGWNPKDSTDRIVLFTESVVTLEFLQKHLPKDLALSDKGKKSQVAILHGGLKDTEIVETVNAFNNANESLRLLICSDVASEGLNLHHCSHRLIHFDVSWSLMVFQQRNGRVDRYGQSIQPEIYYLTTESDARVLEVLIEKDTKAAQNLGDPSEFGTREEQEQRTAEAIESGQNPLDFAAILDSLIQTSGSDVAAFTDENKPTQHTDLPDVIAEQSGVYRDSEAFLLAGLAWMSECDSRIDWQLDGDTVVLNAPADLESRVRRQFPREARPTDNRFLLTADKARVMQDMATARDDESGTFGDLHYLWAQHPVMEWLRQRVSDAFGRHTAPVIRLPGSLDADEHWFLAHGGFPNRRGQTLIQDQVGICFKNDRVADVLPLSECINKLGLNGDKLPNRAEARDCTGLTLYLDDAVKHLRNHLKAARDEQLAELQTRIDAELATLNELQGKHLQQLELSLGDTNDEAAHKGVRTRREQQRDEKLKKIQRHFDDYERWLRDTVATEDEPYMQIVAVVTGSDKNAAGPMQ